MSILNRVVLSFVFVVAAVLGSAGAAGASSAAPYCGITWGSLAKSGGALSQGSLLEARTGHTTATTASCSSSTVLPPATGFNTPTTSTVRDRARS